MDDLLFDDPGEIIAEDAIARVRAHSTEQSRQRYAYLRTRRMGEAWAEGRHIGRRGPNGITWFHADRLSGQIKGEMDD
jgi:hypothetical protein